MTEGKPWYAGAAGKMELLAEHAEGADAIADFINELARDAGEQGAAVMYSDSVARGEMSRVAKLYFGMPCGEGGPCALLDGQGKELMRAAAECANLESMQDIVDRSCTRGMDAEQRAESSGAAGFLMVLAGGCEGGLLSLTAGFEDGEKEMYVDLEEEDPGLREAYRAAAGCLTKLVATEPGAWLLAVGTDATGTKAVCGFREDGGRLAAMGADDAAGMTGLPAGTEGVRYIRYSP